MTQLTSTVRESGESEQRWFCGGGLHTWVATAEETGGSYSCSRTPWTKER
jgi:hypothetical protein